MNLDHVRPNALSAEQRAEWRAYILDGIHEDTLRDVAARLWLAATDREDYDAAEKIAAMTDEWFEPEAEL